VTVAVSYFSLASMAALALFLLIMIPRSLIHLMRVLTSVVTRKPAPPDPWLLTMAVSFAICAGLGVVGAVYNKGAQNLASGYESVTLAFLFFAAPAVLQVLRAWANVHAKQVKVLSHALVAIAILSLPASMAVPTAALLQSTARPAAAPGDPAAAPADNPAAAIADDRFFTDNEVANDPQDYPIAQWLQANFTWKRDMPPRPGPMGQNFYREVPTYTGYWFDQTAEALTFEANDTFGALVSRITHVRANLGFSAAVFLYKLLCALVLVAVTFNVLFGPLSARNGDVGRRRFA
jgi:hypothetical protein